MKKVLHDIIIAAVCSVSFAASATGTYWVLSKMNKKYSKIR